MGNCVKDNPLRTREDVERAAIELIEPLLPLLSPGRAQLHLGDTGASYGVDVAEMEAFARPLWAIVPMLAGGCERVQPIWALWKEGIENGTNPQHPEYWGNIHSYDQRQVEMAVFGYGMAMAPQQFFFSLSEAGQRNLYAWLEQINRTELHPNNWIYFRVLVNIGFMICGLPYNRERLEADFESLEKHYEGDGWYDDLPGQLDYYTPWAFHYYGLIYAKAEEQDYAAPEISLQKHMRMLVTRADEGRQVIAYPAGNCCEAHVHCDAKYEKFAYSTVFGFSVPKTRINLGGAAFDSMLALSEDRVYWHQRYQAKIYELKEDRVISVWHPFAGVQVRTQIIPCGSWHLRIHEIETDRWLHAAEGGFAIACDGEGLEAHREDDRAWVAAPWGVSGIRAICDYEHGEIVRPEANTNLMAPRTLLPALTERLAPGRHRLCAAVYGSPCADAKRFEQLP